MPRTGPKTPAGKRRSSRNALKHGLYSSRLLLPDEDPAVFQALADEVCSTLQPRNFLEAVLANEIALNYWNLLRFGVIHSTELSAAAEETRDRVQEEWNHADSALRSVYAFRAAHSLIDLATRTQSRFTRRMHQAIARFLQLRKASLDSPGALSPDTHISNQKMNKRNTLNPTPSTNPPGSFSVFFQHFCHSDPLPLRVAPSPAPPSSASASSPPPTASSSPPATVPAVPHPSSRSGNPPATTPEPDSAVRYCTAPSVSDR